MSATFVTSTVLLNSTFNRNSISSTSRSVTFKRLHRNVKSTLFTKITPRAEVPAPLNAPSAMEEDNNAIIEGPFTGQFGEWYVRKHDARGVAMYRALLLLSSLSLLPCFILPQTGYQPDAAIYEELTLLSVISFGLSLKYIHIYVRPLHNALKVLWSIGMVGCAASYLLYQSIASIVVSQHPEALLASGWILVALTGVFVKESVCFGRLHAGLLAIGIPVLAGGHFFGLLGERGGQVEATGGTILALAYLWFAISKFGQDPKDDLGDLSVFHHLDNNNGEFEETAKSS